MLQDDDVFLDAMKERGKGGLRPVCDVLGRSTWRMDGIPQKEGGRSAVIIRLSSDTCWLSREKMVAAFSCGFGCTVAENNGMGALNTSGNQHWY